MVSALHCIVFIGEDRLVVELSVHFRLLISIEEEATLVLMKVVCGRA